MAIDPKELLNQFMLALAIWREARGELMQGKIYVGATIINRKNDPKNRWPKTLVGVITQPFQFSSFNPNDPNAYLFPKELDVSWADCVAAASVVLGSPIQITSANHYHTTGVNPTWRDDTKVVATIGHHIFYAL